MASIDCVGNETALDQCTILEGSCSAHLQAGVICTDDPPPVGEYIQIKHKPTTAQYVGKEHLGLHGDPQEVIGSTETRVIFHVYFHVPMVPSYRITGQGFPVQN